MEDDISDSDSSQTINFIIFNVEKESYLTSTSCSFWNVMVTTPSLTRDLVAGGKEFFPHWADFPGNFQGDSPVAGVSS